MLAGLGEDEDVSDLNDRQKAATVWDLLKHSDRYHVRVRRDNGSLWAYDDEAFLRRWLLVEFPNHYPPAERNPTLRGELTADDALSGVLNWAIQGRKRLLTRATSRTKTATPRGSANAGRRGGNPSSNSSATVSTTTPTPTG